MHHPTGLVTQLAEKPKPEQVAGDDWQTGDPENPYLVRSFYHEYILSFDSVAVWRMPIHAYVKNGIAK